ncbi:MAG: hypothetical protein JO112_12730 [Planctomycetes bacterium]|nr:hypothetical protein [Planctomycetota bacterium]
MTSTRTLPESLAGCGVSCAVAAQGSFQAPAEAIKTLRQKLEVIPGEPLAPSFLKHLEEQTLVGLEALGQAIRVHGLSPSSFLNWGVLAAPRFLGRATLAFYLQRYAVEGAWGMSPHFIPHRTLHSVSGAVSLALHLHGPNFGIDGGPGAASQSLLAAVAMLGKGGLPGLWLLLTGWDREPLSKPSATSAGESPSERPPICQAVALALVPVPPGWTGLQLRVTPGSLADSRGGVNGLSSSERFFSLEELREALAGAQGRVGDQVWPLVGGGTVTLGRGGKESEP